MTRRQEVKVKNNPGIYKIQEWDSENAKWIEVGKYRSIRRKRIDGVSKKESAFFENLGDAKSFRLGKIDKPIDGEHRKKNPVLSDDRMRFGKLLEEWKAYHFESVDLATQQYYLRRLPPLEYLSNVPVEEISVRTIDAMIIHWKSPEIVKGRDRTSFEKELDTLKVILNFYKKRFNSKFPVEIYADHYQAAIIRRIGKKAVKTLSQFDLGRFLACLREQKNPIYFVTALIQFCLSLRIQEACGLSWDDFNFHEMTVTIRQVVVWDDKTNAARLKQCPKSRSERVLAIPEILRNGLLDLYRKRDSSVSLVLHKNGQPLVRKTINKAYNRALKLAKIHHVSGTHLLRKTSATQANAITGDFFAVSKNLGHSSVEVTKRYVEAVDASKRKVAQALNGIAEKALGR